MTAESREVLETIRAAIASLELVLDVLDPPRGHVEELGHAYLRGALDALHEIERAGPSVGE